MSKRKNEIASCLAMTECSCQRMLHPNYEEIPCQARDDSLRVFSELQSADECKAYPSFLGMTKTEQPALAKISLPS